MYSTGLNLQINAGRQYITIRCKHKKKKKKKSDNHSCLKKALDPTIQFNELQRATSVQLRL